MIITKILFFIIKKNSKKQIVIQIIGGVFKKLNKTNPKIPIRLPTKLKLYAFKFSTLFINLEIKCPIGTKQSALNIKIKIVNA